MKINKTLVVATIITLSLASSVFASSVNALENIPNIKLTRAENLLRKLKNNDTNEVNHAETSSSETTNLVQNDSKYKARLERLAKGRVKNHEKLVSKIDLEITNLTQKNIDTSKAKLLFKEYKASYEKLSNAGVDDKQILKVQTAKLLKDLRKELKSLWS